MGNGVKRGEEGWRPEGTPLRTAKQRWRPEGTPLRTARQRQRWHPKGMPLRTTNKKATPRDVAPGFSPASSGLFSREVTRCAPGSSDSSNPASGNRRANIPAGLSKDLFERDSSRCTRRRHPRPLAFAGCDRNRPIARGGGPFFAYSKTRFVV